jgi:class 3 adenylate cyclase
MRRSRAVDWWLLGTLLPLYLVLQAAGIQAQLASGARTLPFVHTGAQGTDGYPIMLGSRAPDPRIQRGDRVLRIGSLDLRGLSWADIRYRTVPLQREGRPFEVELERGGVRFDLSFEPLPNPRWWWTVPVWTSFALTGVFLLLRAPHWHLSRRIFAAYLLLGCWGATWASPVHPVFVFAGLVVANPLQIALFLWAIFEWTRPGPWLRAIPWAIGITQAGYAARRLLTLPLYPFELWPSPVIANAFVAFLLAGLTRAYLRSDPVGRRQLRWILYGAYVGTLPLTLFLIARAIAPATSTPWEQVALLFLAAIPLGNAIAIVGYGWLDIDRVISASAATTLVGIALVGGVLTVVPPAARGASASLGIDPETGRLVLSMALAAVLVPAYRVLHPWLDRRLFAERHELAQRFERLRSELGACRGVEEMASRAGEGFDALLHPESIAIYGRAGDAFTPLFARGSALPPAFEAGSMLVQVLEAKKAPLFARAKEIAPFERAALETLGAEVVVPQLREGQLVAFTCLAGKRSGDIYIASDLALLAAVAERCGEVIARIDADTLVREAQAMQSALRRYVPGAVAERVLAGDALEPAEREVTVLFVDIRDYTRTTAGLRPADVFATLNEHTERVSRIVQECGGTIVEFNGDGLMAVFGAPEALARKEQQAVEAARRIVDSMPETLAVGVGVATGAAFVGSIRSTDRLIWSAVGSTTNLASRLQSMTRELGASIALDETTRERGGYVCADFARHADVAIRGRLGRFDIFSLPLRREHR